MLTTALWKSRTSAACRLMAHGVFKYFPCAVPCGAFRSRNRYRSRPHHLQSDRFALFNHIISCFFPFCKRRGKKTVIQGNSHKIAALILRSRKQESPERILRLLNKYYQVYHCSLTIHATLLVFLPKPHLSGLICAKTDFVQSGHKILSVSLDIVSPVMYNEYG